LEADFIIRSEENFSFVSLLVDPVRLRIIVVTVEVAGDSNLLAITGMIQMLIVGDRSWNVVMERYTIWQWARSLRLDLAMGEIMGASEVI